MDSTKIAKLRAIAAAMRELFPGEDSVSVTVDSRVIGVSYHGCKTYQEATDWLRSWGGGVRNKTPHDCGTWAYTALSSKVDDIMLTTYPDELPPSCMRVEYVEKVPKSEVVTHEGEYVEIKRTKIVCGALPDVEESK